MTLPTPPSSEFLLDQLAWIRALAGHLVADEGVREDLVQDTFVQALERPPSDVRRGQQWLATVMRNLVRQRARGEGRRRDREQQSARPEKLEPTDELIERATRQRDLVQRVLELHEPYRSALLLRYFDQLPPREIARRQAVPVATVHSRLKRALAQLREGLDQEHGGNRQAWLALFIPLADTGHKSVTPTLIGALIVNTKLVVAILAAVAVGTGLSIVGLDDANPSVPAASTALALETAAPSVLSKDEDAFGASEPVLVSRKPIEPSVPAAIAKDSKPGDPVVAETNRIEGQVLDAYGHPLSGIAVGVEKRRATTSSGIDGRFEIETEQAECRLLVADPEWVTVHEGFYRKDSFDPVLVAAPAIQLAGEVISEAGRPLANVYVSFRLPAGFDTRFAEILDSTRSKNWRVFTDAEGRFELFDVPAIEDSSITAMLDGYELGSIDAPLRTDQTLLVTLERPKQVTKGALNGTVVDQNGEPVAGARVATGLVSTVTDDEGRFNLDLHRAVTPTNIAAVKAGFLPARMERPFPAETDNAGWPEQIELRLGGPALSLRGKVVRPDGTPMPGARVWLANTNRFGTIGLMPTSFENLMGGAQIPPQTLESSQVLPDTDGDSEWNSAVGGAPSSAAWFWKLTDENGDFEFDGLFDQDYRVHVLDLDSLVEFESEYLHPGSGRAKIEAPEAELFAEVAGHVVDNFDRPLKGVRVSLRSEPVDESTRVFGGTSRMMMNVNRETTVTDEQGRFAFKDVPRNGIQLIFLSDEIVPDQAWLKDFEADPTAIVMAVDARCHVSIELEPGNLANRFRFLDSEGEHLTVHRISEGSHSESSDGEIINLRSGVVSVSSRATQVVLYQGDAQLEVIDLELWPGEINEIRSNH